MSTNFAHCGLPKIPKLFLQTKVDELTTGVLVREDESPEPEDITLSTEAMLFSGRRNAIYLTREYYQEYACRFDLIFYPFDTQLCFMTFEVQGKTDNYIKLGENRSLIVNNRTLIIDDRSIIVSNLRKAREIQKFALGAIVMTCSYS